MCVCGVCRCGTARSGRADRRRVLRLAVERRRRRQVPAGGRVQRRARHAAGSPDHRRLVRDHPRQADLTGRRRPARQCHHADGRHRRRTPAQGQLDCRIKSITHTHIHTHPFNGPLSGSTRVSRYQKGKTNLDFTEARDSEWQWHQLSHMQVCTSLLTDDHASTPPLSFFTGRMPFLPPNQQRQSTEGKRIKSISRSYIRNTASYVATESQSFLGDDWTRCSLTVDYT